MAHTVWPVSMSLFNEGYEALMPRSPGSGTLASDDRLCTLLWHLNVNKMRAVVVSGTRTSSVYKRRALFVAEAAVFSAQG